MQPILLRVKRYIQNIAHPATVKKVWVMVPRQKKLKEIWEIFQVRNSIHNLMEQYFTRAI